MPKISEDKRHLNKIHLIKVATELFMRKGYSKTTVNDIVREAKVSKGGFYTYFDSKESLFFEIIHGEDQQIIHQGEKLVTKNEYNTLSKYIEYRLRRYFDEENRIRAKYTFEFWSSTTLTLEQIESLNRRYKEFETDISSMINLGQKSGIYSIDIDIKSFIHILLSTIDGLIIFDTVLYRPINEDVIKTTIEMMNLFLENKRGKA